MHEIELLAPVGGWESLIAAVQNGADAVYLGGKAFNARQSANNFDEKELKKAVEYCHIRGVRVFITVNTLISDTELMELGKYLLFLYNIDVDAIIVQDLGVVKLIRDLLPDFELHASTQMSIHNLEGVKLLEDLGVKRVVLAREMSKEEINWVQKHTKLDVEIFVHGALCVCYSGQCLMSSMIGGRSGNRGRCAQPCRMTYSLVDLKSGKQLENTAGDYLLSTRDLNTLENIHEILDTGIKSLKIEGRMKRPEYVATVVSAYRQAIDQYKATKGKPSLTQEILTDVEQMFNRRFTKGYIMGHKGTEIMSFSKPSNRGIKIGEVVSYDKNKKRLFIKLEKPLSKGDGIEIWSTKGDNPGTIVENIFVKGEKKDKSYGAEIVEISFKHWVESRSDVYKTSDIELLSKAKKSYERKDKGISLYGEFIGNLGNPIELVLWDDKKHTIYQKGDYVVEEAIKTSITKERVYEQISKLGDTPYELKELRISIEDNIAIPIGELNKLRRNAIEELNKLRQSHNKRPALEAQTFELKLKDWFKATDRILDENISLNVYVNTLDQLRAALDFGIDKIYYGDLSTMEEARKIASSKNMQFIGAFPSITEDRELARLKDKIDSFSQYHGVMVANLGELNILKNLQNVHIYGDYTLNVFNNKSIGILKDMGLEGVTLSPELTLTQIKEIAQKAPISWEVIIHGQLPVMVTKYCPISAVGKENRQACALCEKSQFGLKDRMGMIFPVLSNGNCKVQILNAQTLCLIEHMEELLNANIRNFRLQFTYEAPKEIADTIKAYKEVINAHLSGQSVKTFEGKSFIEKMRKKGLTKGHYFRGVL